MAEHTLPAVFAAVLWWFATGVILYLDRLPAHTFRYSMLGGTVVLGGALYGLVATATDTSVGGAYLAFTCGVLLWGWLEMSFLMGFIMGPRRHACADGCSGRRHFVHAIQAILYHELAIIMAGAMALALTWDAPNQMGWWSFLILWGMRTSAKLNLFLGVRNLGEQFLPPHLEYLLSYFRRSPMNFLFPVSVTVGTAIAVSLILRALADDASPFEVAGYGLLATMMTLAVIEHWFLVLPIPSEALWRWTLRLEARRPAAKQAKWLGS